VNQAINHFKLNNYKERSNLFWTICNSNNKAFNFESISRTRKWSLSWTN